MQKKFPKIFFVFYMIASELVALTCLYQADNACQRLSMSEETLLGFCVSLKETFSNATTLAVINKSCDGAEIQIPTVFRYICCLVCLRVL